MVMQISQQKPINTWMIREYNAESFHYVDLFLPFPVCSALQRNNHLCSRHPLLLQIESCLKVLKTLANDMWIWSSDV